MRFELGVSIGCPPDVAFAFLRDKEKHGDRRGAVRRLEKTTPGPARVGTRYREVVRVLPAVERTFYSRLTVLEPGRRLEEDWGGAGMRGHLAYRFEPCVGGTRLTQTQEVIPEGTLVVLGPLIRLSLGLALRRRLGQIKRLLERRGAGGGRSSTTP